MSPPFHGPIASLSLAALLLLPAGRPLAQQPPEMTLRIEAGPLDRGLPNFFTLVFKNVSNHDLRLPKPYPECNDSLRGSLQIDLVYTPALDAKPTAGNKACFVHEIASDILVRSSAWMTLRPGESFRSTQTRTTYSEEQGGTYRFIARYVPAYVSAEDLREMQHRGFSVPQTQIVSSSLLFKR